MKKDISSREGHPAARFSSEIKTRMGQQLRAAYSEVMNQGIPDGHYELLLRLDGPHQTSRE